MNGITFTEDCLIGASNAFERWFCTHKVPLLTGFAWQGILTEVIISVSVLLAVVILAVLVVKNKKKRASKRF